MSGELARRGFRFQDLCLLNRVLNEAAASFAHAAGEGQTPHKRLKFGIEAKTVSSKI